MAKERKKQKIQEAKVDMTPMIDLTFLLVMFFVLTSSFSPKLEEVQLPAALKASESDERDLDDGVLIINVRKSKDADRAGEIVYNGKVLEPKELEEVLKKEARYHRETKGWTEDFSRLNVRVRADESARAEMLREVFFACSKAKIWKVKLSAEKP